MSNIQNIDISLQEIVKKISKDAYLIPKFQRDFVWKTKDILDLGDSLVRGYPISSLLIMAENGTLNVGSHSLSKDDPPKDYDEKNSDDSEVRFYILDGQQRLTSISKIFLTFDNKNEYYFDLLAILIDKYPDDEIDKDKGVLERCSKSKISDVFCRYFPISSDRSEKPTRQNNRFISGKNIIENRFGSVVSKFLRVFTDASEEEIDKYTDHLNAVLGSVGGYSVPATVIASDSELGIVIRVFEKVNSTGKKLTLFDLINAKSFQTQNEAYKVGLSDYLTNEIIEQTTVNTELKDGVENFFKYDADKRGFDKLDKIVRIFEVASLLKKGSVPSIFQSIMLSKDSSFWFETWNEMGPQMLEIISWMEAEDLIDIGQITFLEYALAIFLANPDSFSDSKFRQEIKKYALFLAISGSGFSKSNLDTVERLHQISLQITGAHASEKYNFTSAYSNPNITSSQILEITTSSSRFKAIMNIFYSEKAHGKFTVDIAGTSIKGISKDYMDNHHIFPKSRVTNFTAKSQFNSIANIILIDRTTNREIIKDRPPSDYIKEMNSTTVKHNCDQNLIDLDKILLVSNEETAKEFIENRSVKISASVNSYFG